MKVKIYGCRGSAAYSRDSFYGGNTSCIALESDDCMLILDAGSGIMKLDAELRAKFPGYPNNLPFKPNILISHLHLDHIIGLVGFAPIWSKNTGTRIFTCSRGDTALSEQVFGVFKPPYWPTPMTDASCAEMVEVSDTFKADKFTVTPFIANHSDTTLSYYLTDGLSSVVHLLDNEICEKSNYDELLNYCRNADLVVFDAAYLQKDYLQKIGWGHSCVQEGIKLAEQSGCKRMLFAHFAQEYTDDDLTRLKEIVPDGGRFIFAYEGLEIEV